MALRPTEGKLPITVKNTPIVGGRDTGDAGTVSPPRLDDDIANPDQDEEDVPEGFDSVEEFLAFWSKTYTADYEADDHNIKEAKEDLRFIYVDQWDEDTRKEREENGRPCLTINTLPQFIGQVIGDRRINKTSVKIIPSHAGSVHGATVRSGLLRSIANYSNADRVFDMCCEDQVGCGISNFEVTLEYSKNDVFKQDIFYRPLTNPFAVVWDRMSRDPTGKDANHCFVQETMVKTTFEKEFPDYPVVAPFGEVHFGDEEDGDEVKIIALWHMVEKPATFALMEDGQVEDVTDKPEEEYAERLHIDEQGQAYIKEGVRTYARRWLLCRWAILDGPYDLPLSRLPIIKVSGRIGRVGVKQYRFGLIRWARDPSLLRNYWRSTAAEVLAMAPKTGWIADAASVKGREQDFRDSHLTGDPLLVYNTGKNKPERIDPPTLPTAVLQEATMNAQDIKDVTGLQDASLGVRSNEVSGKAIMARQREGDVATITFHDHMDLAIEEGGLVVNELIPVAYDTTRTLRVIGVDDAIEFVKVNDPSDEESPDLTMGKYDTQLITGPSYTTQRMESAEAMLEMTKVMPELMSQAADIIVEVQDWPGAERIAKRFKALIPAAQQEEAEKKAAEAAASGQQPPQEQVDPAQAAQAQMAEMQMQAAQAEMQFKQQEMEAKLREANARADKAEADARAAALAVDKAEEEIRIVRANAEKAEHETVASHQEVDRQGERHDLDMELKRNPPERPASSNSKGGGSQSRKATRK